jgi:hypothetical protein
MTHNVFSVQTMTTLQLRPSTQGDSRRDSFRGHYTAEVYEPLRQKAEKQTGVAA